MTKLFSIIAVAFVATTFVACGPSAEEKAQIEAKLQHDADSISALVTEGIETAVSDASATTTEAAPATAETAPAATEPAKATEAPAKH
ncbi:MAG: hypothetical protein ACK504_00345 [Bacteroidota bacterium]|jgi:hypothetical protein